MYGGGDETFRADLFNREDRYIISRFGMSPRCVRFVEDKFFLNDSGFTIVPSSELVDEDFLNLYLYLNQEDIYLCGRGVGQKNIDFEQFNALKIPIPPKDIQEKIVKEIEVIEKESKKSSREIESLQNEISKVVSNNSKKEKLENIQIMLRRGKSPKYGYSNVQIIKSGQARGYKEFDFSEKHFVSEDFILDERKLEKGDILINSSGVGTAGRVTLFNLDGDFVVDSHVSILRLDTKKALSNYVLYSLAGVGFKTIESMATGQSGQIELSLPTIQNIKIPLPPLLEQQKIVAQIEKIEEKITKLESLNAEIPRKKEEILKKYL